MRRRDSDSLPFRAVYLGLRGEFRVRQTLRSLRHASGWRVAGTVWLVLALAFRSWILFAAFCVLLLLTAVVGRPSGITSPAHASRILTR